MKIVFNRRRFLYISAFIVLILIFLLSLPEPLFDQGFSPVLYDREGRLLGARVAGDGQWRFPETYFLNEKFVIALIEAEDRRFRYHPGVDPLALARAVVQNIRRGIIVSGASTLTMQTIRLSRIAGGRSGGRTFLEKIIEAVLAVRLELRYSKEEILRLYAANAPFGGNVVGLDAASWRWFGRSSADLSWAEAAALAVLPNSPALIHPGRNRLALGVRRDALLRKLHERGFFDEETLILSLAENLPGEPLPLPRLAPHLLDRLILEGGGAETFSTSIDRDIQERAGAILNRASLRFMENDINNGAVLILNTRTGEVIAYVGNTGSGHSQDVDIIRARRSSGSLLKPLLYAAMLDSGDILPSSLVSDIPTRVGSFSPENITHTYLGVVPADEALTRSLNVPAARLLRTYGVERFTRLLRSLGLTTLFRTGEEYGLPLILGGAETTLWEITHLYAALGRTIEAGLRLTGTESPAYNLTPHITPGAAWLTLEALVRTVRPGEEAIWQEFASARNIAWKTGTSNGFRDAWAIGVTPDWTVGVWIGNATGEGRAELRSALTSAPVLFEIFNTLETGQRWFFQPAAELRYMEVCAISGFPAGVHCERLSLVQVPLNSPYQNACPYCRTIILNEAGDRQISIGAGSTELTMERSWFVLPPAEEWYYRRWNLDYRPLPPFHTDSVRDSGFLQGGLGVMALFNPEPESQVYIPREIDGREGRIVFSAAHRNDDEIIHWHLGESYLGYTQTFHEMEARPPSGRHTLTLIDSAGNTIDRNFTVLSEAN